MKTKTIASALFPVLCIAFLASSPGARAGREYPEEEHEFCWQEIAPAVEIYLEKDMQAGMDRIEEGYLRYEAKYPHPELDTSCCTPYYQSVWWEAQVKSGREDEEWGLELFTYLLERSRRKNPLLNTEISGNHYALLGNIMERCESTGRIAEMRAWARQLENDLETKRGMDLECTGYPDRGAVFSFMPQARKHVYPMKHRDFPKEIYPCQCKSHVYYTYIYGLRDVAAAYLSQGDWVRSAELYQWFLDYADETLLEDRKGLTFPSEMVHEAAMVTQKMADICALHGHPEEGVRFYADYIERAEGYYESEPVHIYNSKLRAELLRIEMGELSDDAIEVADKACELMADNQFYSRWDLFDLRIARARIYHAAGSRDEAWAMMEELLALGEADITPRHRVRMLGGAIALALADGGTRPELEGWLMEALENERRLGNKFGELSLYVQYARFLALNDRFSEAETIQREAVRLAKATNLPDRFAAETQRLADLQNHRPEAQHPGGMAASASRQDDGIGIDLQPRRSGTAALEGGIAFGRFFLSNPSAGERSGTLTISGPVAQPKYANPVSIALDVSPEFDETQLEQPVTLPSGGCYMVDFAGTSLPDGSGAQVRCNWQPANESQPAISSYWEYAATLDGHRTAVIDAHAVKANPFYLVPIHHTLQRAVAEQQTVVDLVVCASMPVRLELYDAKTSELVYVDANGDGDFEDAGDLITSDSNGNHWPDLAMPPAETLRSFVMYIEQTQPEGSTLELQIKVLENGVWITDSVDLVE